MAVTPGQSVTVCFTTQNPSTGAAADADSTPTGTVVVSGTSNGASVTVTNRATGDYKAAFTVPTTIVPGDVVELVIAATVSSTAGKRVVWRESFDPILKVLQAQEE